MEISVFLVDNNGTPLTGKSAYTDLTIRRVSDGFLLDWNDLTFKGSAWVAPSVVLTEIDGTNLPGVYRKTVVVTSWIDDFYQCILYFDDTVTKNSFYNQVYLQGGREVEINLDAAVSSRMATFTYTAPDNAGISTIDGIVDAIKLKTDLIPASPAAVGSEMTLTSAYDAAKVAASATAVNAIPTNPLLTNDIRLGNLDTTISSRSTLTAQQVWEYATRTLTAFSTLVSDVWSYATRALTDKAGFSISGTTQTLDALATQIQGVDGDTLKVLSDQIDTVDGNVDAIKVKTDFLPSAANLDVAVSSRSTLTDQQVWAYVTRSITDKAGFTISGTKQTLDSLHDATQGATKAELDASQAIIQAAINALNDITVNDILSGVVEGTITVKQSLIIALAVLAGKSEGSGTAYVSFRNQLDTKDTVLANVDLIGNRIAVTLDV